jgi:methenyltetrahydromethanopterin cyclohydrolase
MPASSSSDYGTPFYETFKRYNGDFYKIDKLLFSPAEVWLTSATTGKTFHGGLLNPEVLRGSLFEE